MIFRIGDVVRLKSEFDILIQREQYWINPWMTVVKPYDNGIIKCGWFTKNRKYVEAPFQMEALAMRPGNTNK